MSYAEMSDFEINKAVHLVLLKKGKIKEQFRISPSDFVDVFRNSFGEPSVIAVMRYVVNGLSDGYNPFGGAFDYCNNPSDAWPIIDGIIKSDCIVQILKAGVIVDLAGGGRIQCMHKNPLRAAMIVFLMVNEDK